MRAHPRPHHCHRAPKESSRREDHHFQMSPSYSYKIVSYEISRHPLYPRPLGRKRRLPLNHGIHPQRPHLSRPNRQNQTIQTLRRFLTTCAPLCDYSIYSRRVLTSITLSVQNAPRYYSRPYNGNLMKQKRSGTATSLSRRKSEKKRSEKDKI